MKIALCLSGELRRVDLFYPIIYNNILEPYNPDVFVSTWDMPSNIATSVGNTIRDPTEISTIEYIKKMYKPIGIHIQKYTQEIKDRLINIGKTRNDNLLCMTFNIYKTYCLANDRTILNGKNYDIVIRYRFDYGIKIKFEDYNLEQINIPNEHAYGGYQDQFAFGNMKVMSLYSEWFKHLSNIENNLNCNKNLPTNQNNIPGYPWHPESSLKRYLTYISVPVNLISNLNIRYPWCTKQEIEELYD